MFLHSMDFPSFNGIHDSIYFVHIHKICVLSRKTVLECACHDIDSYYLSFKLLLVEGDYKVLPSTVITLKKKLFDSDNVEWNLHDCKWTCTHVFLSSKYILSQHR